MTTKLLSRLFLPLALFTGAYGILLIQANGTASMGHAWHINSLFWIISACVLGVLTILFTRIAR